MKKTLELQNLALSTLPESAYEYSQIWRNKLTIEKGERILISAPSGKGKSSLISLLYGLKRDFTGIYRINGSDTRHFSQEDWSQTRASVISIVFQDLRLFMDYSGWENLAIKGKLPPAEFDENTIRIMADHLGVENLLDKKCGAMSYGERQRMAIIRSLLMPADFLIMDEPFSHLDDENTAKAIELIDNETTKNNSAVIITSLGSSYDWSFDRNILL